MARCLCEVTLIGRSSRIGCSLRKTINSYCDCTERAFPSDKVMKNLTKGVSKLWQAGKTVLNGRCNGVIARGGKLNKW